MSCCDGEDAEAAPNSLAGDPSWAAASEASFLGATMGRWSLLTLLLHLGQPGEGMPRPEYAELLLLGHRGSSES